MRTDLPYALYATVLTATLLATQARAGNFEFSYSGRLVEENGKPVEGPIALKVSFFHSSISTTPVLEVSKGLESIQLQEGTFQITVGMSPDDYNMVFPAVGQPVFVQITDMTHAPTSPYASQQVLMAPYAAKVPVDGKTLSFDSQGNLGLSLTSAPAANQFLTKNTSGELIWATPAAATATMIQGQTISPAAPAAGQALVFNGTQWVPTTVASGVGSVTSVTASAPLAVANGTTTPVVSMAQATSVSSGYLSNSDWLNFTGKLSKAGDTMAGPLAMGTQKITGLGAPAAADDAATKGYVDSLAVRLDGTTPLTGPWAVGGQNITGLGHVALNAGKTFTLGTYNNAAEVALTATLGSTDAGKAWFNSQTNQVKYWDGSAAQGLGVAGSGLTPWMTALPTSPLRKTLFLTRSRSKPTAAP